MQLCENKDDIFVKIVANHLGNSHVAIPAMNHQETLQILKLTDSVVSRSHRLCSFFTSYSYTDMCL